MPNCVGGAWATQSITRSRCARDSGSATSCGLPNDRHVGPNGSREPSLAAQLARPCRLASPPFRPDAACHDSAANDSPARTCCSKPLGAGEHPSRQALRRETIARRGDVARREERLVADLDARTRAPEHCASINWRVGSRRSRDTRGLSATISLVLVPLPTMTASAAWACSRVDCPCTLTPFTEVTMDSGQHSVTRQPGSARRRVRAEA